MSSRSNSSARNRRAGPSSNIQDTLTNNQNIGYTNISSMQQNTSSVNNDIEKQEHKLLSITQAFMLINGKIRNLETQLDGMNKIIETHNVTKNISSNDNSITPQVPNYEEMSDVSEFKQNMGDDFYEQDSKMSNQAQDDSDQNMNMIEPSLINVMNDNNLNNDFDNKVMFDEVKSREVAQDVTNNALQNYDEKISELDSKGSKLEVEYNKLNTKTSEISNKLNSIEQLIQNIEKLNVRLPVFMESVESRFENLKLTNSSNESLVRDTMEKVDANLNKYNDKLENVKGTMSNMQEYAVSLHNLVINRFDKLVEEKYIPKHLDQDVDVENNIEDVGKKVLFDMKKNETTEIENCLENKGKGDFNINEYEEPNNTETLEGSIERDLLETMNSETLESSNNFQEVETMNSETLESSSDFQEAGSKKKRKKNKNTMKLEVDSEEQESSVSA